MGEIVITQNITLDGVVEATDDWFGAQDDASADDMLAAVREQMAREAGLLIGRRTFEDLRGFWPTLTDDATGVTAHLNAVDKYVVSTTMTDPAWEHTTVLRGGDTLAEEVARVRDAHTDGDVGVTGSIGLCHDLLAVGLVDELRLFVYPVVIGHGRRLFPDGLALGPLRHTDSRSFASGISLETYRLR